MEVYVAEKKQRIEERQLALLAGRFALSAFGANPFEHVGGSVEMKVVGESYFRDGDVAQAVGALADFAVEVCVVVRQSDMAAFVAAAVLFAYGIFGLSASVVHAMDEVLVQKERQGAEDGRFVHCDQHVFQVPERDGAAAFCQFAQDEQAHSSGFHPAHF